MLENVNYCKDHHLNIYFQKENISIFNPDGSENPFLTIMIAVLSSCAELEREAIYYRLNSGKNKYIADGGKVGRKVEYRKTLEVKKEEYREVIRHLKRGTTISDTAKLTGHCVRTVQIIKKRLESKTKLANALVQTSLFVRLEEYAQIEPAFYRLFNTVIERLRLFIASNCCICLYSFNYIANKRMPAKYAQTIK